MLRARAAASSALVAVGSWLVLAAGMQASCAAAPEVAHDAASDSSSARAPVEALPFSLCSAYGAAGTPCYPTTADRAGRPVAACRDPFRGRCESRAGRAVCLLAVASDGRPCTMPGGAAGSCQDGRCVEPR
ncbi:MAG: hypothetical protein U1A78_33350 [Polyangia bacterium]